jgi:type IV fimbrial biogenesis protein FimT
MLTARRAGGAHHGFTLVELLVVVAIVAVSATLAAPSFAQMIANYRVRGAADGILGALNFARTEALRRNTPVAFALSSGGSGWSVSQLSTSTTLQSRSAGDVPGLSVTSSSSATSVTFLANGLIQSGTQLSELTVASAVGNANTRRIHVFGGGLIRMCDPAVTAASDPRRC